MIDRAIGLSIDLDGPGPAYRRIYHQIRQAILEDTLAPGTRLPASRQLAGRLRVARITVVQAYDQLVAEGYLHTRAGAGTYVAPCMAPGVARADTAIPAAPRLAAYAQQALNLSTGCPAAASPSGLRWDFQYGRPELPESVHREWRRAVRRAARGLTDTYPDAQGEPLLRGCLAAFLRDWRGMAVKAESILIVAGAQQALSLIGQCVIEAGDKVVLEEPHYQGARQIFQALGARLISVPVDADGLRTDRLPAPARGPVRLACVTPSHQFPLGSVLSMPRRLELLHWADRHDAALIEDDYDSEYRHEGAPLHSLFSLDQGRRVLYVGTFSKVLSPALRLGYIVMPEAWRDALIRAKWLTDRGAAVTEQLAVAELLRSGAFRRHLNRTSARLAERRRTLVAALRHAFGDQIQIPGARAGMHLVVRWPHRPATQTPALIEHAARHGIGIYSTTPYYAGPPPACVELLLGYASLDVAHIRDAVAALRSCMAPCNPSG